MRNLKSNFKFYDITNWETDNYNTHISRYLKNKGNQTMKFGQLIEYNMRSIFPEKPYLKCGAETAARAFPNKSKLRMPLD